MAYNNIYNQQLPNQYQNHFFPQPNGNVYTINSSNELSNIPVGVGLTVVLCLSENTLYLKTIQNGNPVVWSYKLSPNEDNQNIQTSIEDKYEQFNERLSKLEKHWEVLFDEQLKS